MQLASDADEAYAKTTAAAIAPGAACPVVLPTVCALVCSLPFGIAALLFALNSRAAFAEGDYARAAKARRRSMLLSYAAMIWSALMILLLLILTF